MIYKLKKIIRGICEIIMLILLFPYIAVSRYRKKIDVGLGPEPLINNVYHKKALEEYGYSVETFTYKPYYITNDFDIIISEKFNINNIFVKIFGIIYFYSLPFKYRLLYIYFNGGVFYNCVLLSKLEPYIYKIARTKTVVMPYGSDVQEMSRTSNLLFKNAMTLSYPMHKTRRKSVCNNIDFWTKFGDHVISGCEWVDYMYSWDTLMLSHFSISTEISKSELNSSKNTDAKFRVLHAPNHRDLKGTGFLISAINELKSEGLDIELVMLEKVSNAEVIKLIQEVDLVADQFIIGWYAMFAIEAMKFEKPVLCYLRDDLIDLYTSAGLINHEEIPIINTDLFSIKDSIRKLYNNRSELKVIGKNSREYILKHHSTKYIGQIFSSINEKLL